MYEVLSGIQSKKCGDAAEKQWKLDRQIEGRPSVYAFIWKLFGMRILAFGFIDLAWKIFNRYGFLHLKLLLMHLCCNYVLTLSCSVCIFHTLFRNA